MPTTNCLFFDCAVADEDDVEEVADDDCLEDGRGEDGAIAIVLCFQPAGSFAVATCVGVIPIFLVRSEIVGADEYHLCHPILILPLLPVRSCVGSIFFFFVCLSFSKLSCRSCGCGSGCLVCLLFHGLSRLLALIA